MEAGVTNHVWSIEEIVAARPSLRPNPHGDTGRGATIRGMKSSKRVVTKSVGSALIVAAIVMLIDSVSAKGRTVRLTITGQHIGQPIDVTNPKALIDVWTGTRRAESWLDFPRAFFGDVSEEPAAALPRYTVSFYVDAFAEQPHVRKLYVVRYVPDPRTSEGFVYLPGPREAEAVTNHVISRPGKDGRWLRASAEWSAAINAHIAATGRP